MANCFILPFVVSSSILVGTSFVLLVTQELYDADVIPFSQRPGLDTQSSYQTTNHGPFNSTPYLTLAPVLNDGTASNGT